MQIHARQVQIQQIQTAQFFSQSIYFVLPGQRVRLQVVKSDFIQPDKINEDLSIQGTINALKYRYSLKYLGKQYQNILVLCIPAKQHKLNNIHTQQNNDVMNNKDILFFIKVPSDYKNEIRYQGYASGKRSAIVTQNNKLIRYKGCGNFTSGFPVQNNQLRGCHFFHTAKRQLYITNLINKILQRQIGHKSGNIPICMYQYNNEQIINKFNLKCDLQLLGKYCCVFQTKGDRRVGTHIISPLQILFLNIINLNQTNWMQLFTNKNRIDQGQPIEFLPYWIFLQPNQQFLTRLYKQQPKNNYILLNQVDLSVIQHKQRQIFIQKLINKLIKKQQQKQFVRQYLLNIPNNLKQLISMILQKIGYQMGQIKRIFCQNSINWGYFNDHGNLWHCNAHLNNFIITIPQNDSQFLLPLDFDLAFTRQQFIVIDLDKQMQQKYGKYDKDQFQNFLCSQYQAMQMSISGIQVMNFNYAIDYQQKQQKLSIDPKSSMRMARIVYRDTLLKSFRDAMKKQQNAKQNINKKWNQNIQQINKLIKLSLIISQDFQT